MKKILLLLCFTPLMAFTQNILDSDCPTTNNWLENKTTLTIQPAKGGGVVITEANDAKCFSSGGIGNFESNSSWFKWTCDKAGTLTFLLSPFKFNDDLDFVLYETNDINACSNRVVLRCMASGETSGGCKLLGSTGLTDWADDISEPTGCSPSQDNFLKQLAMEKGKSYALMVNNFSSNNAPFIIEFGGTGTFKANPLVNPDVDNSFDFSVFPNPSSDASFFVKMADSAHQNNCLEVYNMLGVLVFRKENIDANTRIQLNSDLPEGVYFIKYKVDNQFVTKKWTFGS